MDLQGENRILVKEGLKRLSHTSNKGLRELIRANGLEDGPITAYHVGFVLGPCINASGRLDTAARSLKLLCAETEDEAAKLAGDLTALNQSRKALTEEGKGSSNPYCGRDRNRTGQGSCDLFTGLSRKSGRNYCGTYPRKVQ